MTPEQAAMIIQNAWRIFDDDRKAKFCAEYQAELMDTYYRECCTPGSWDMGADMPYDCSDTVEEYVDDMDDYDPPDEITYYVY
jgi:hypothetical protein